MTADRLIYGGKGIAPPCCTSTSSDNVISREPSSKISPASARTPWITAAAPLPNFRLGFTNAFHRQGAVFSKNKNSNFPSSEKCRAGKGPVFVECLTHRMRGHYEGDPAKYRELSQLAEWKKKDPIARVARALKSQKTLANKELAAMENEAQALAEKAAEFSLASPWPADDQVARQVTSD